MRPWVSFVNLSFLMALGPGFLLGALMLVVPLAGPVDPSWYGVARQAHGHAQLTGWGGAMILGVGLYFLPRLRGSRRNADRWVVPWFWLFALGLAARVVGPLLSPWLPVRWELVLLMGGTWLETAGGLGLTALLIWVMRDGPPLAKKRAFMAMLPLLAVAGASFLLALAVWAVGAFGASGGVLPAAYDRAAVDLATLIFIPAISIGMSVRVFPLFFRVPVARHHLLPWSALFLAAGAAFILIRAVLPQQPVVNALALLLPGTGIAVGTIAVRVFEKRAPFPGDRGIYSPWKEPAAIGAVSAYIWGALASIVLLLAGAGHMGMSLTHVSIPHDLVLHMLGAGFMTLLILAVAPIMLPGFAGVKPAAKGWIWLAIIAGNLAALARVVPLMLRTFPGQSGATQWSMATYAAAGVLGIVAVTSLAVQLRISGLRASG